MTKVRRAENSTHRRADLTARDKCRYLFADLELKTWACVTRQISGEAAFRFRPEKYPPFRGDRGGGRFRVSLLKRHVGNIGVKVVRVEKLIDDSFGAFALHRRKPGCVTMAINRSILRNNDKSLSGVPRRNKSCIPMRAPINSGNRAASNLHTRRQRVQRRHRRKDDNIPLEYSLNS